MSKRKTKGAVVQMRPQRQTEVRTVDGFANLAARIGTQAGTPNILSQGQWTPNLLTQNQRVLDWMYRSSWLVGTLVDCVAEDMTRAGIEVQGECDPEQSREFQSRLSRLGVWAAITEGIKWGRLYGGAIGFIDIEGQDPSMPLRIDTVASGQFKGLRVWDRWDVSVSSDLVRSGLNAGTPVMYEVVSERHRNGLPLKIHHSRVLRFLGDRLPRQEAEREQYWGASILERPYDEIMAFATASGGAANLIGKAYLRTIGVDGMRDILAQKDGEAKLAEWHMAMAQLQDSAGITLIDKEDTFTAHTYTYAGLLDLLNFFLQQVAGAQQIPLVRLAGQSPAGLNATGDSDWRNYYDGINSRQEASLRDPLTRVCRVAWRSIFGQAPPDDFDIEFASLWQMTEEQRATIAKTETDRVLVAYEAGLIDQATALRELQKIAEDTGAWSTITDAMVDMAEMEPPPAPAAVAPETPASEEPAGMLARLKAWAARG